MYSLLFLGVLFLLLCCLHQQEFLYGVVGALAPLCHMYMCSWCLWFVVVIVDVLLIRLLKGCHLSSDCLSALPLVPSPCLHHPSSYCVSVIDTVIVCQYITTVTLHWELHQYHTDNIYAMQWCTDITLSLHGRQSVLGLPWTLGILLGRAKAALRCFSSSFVEWASDISRIVLVLVWH